MTNPVQKTLSMNDFSKKSIRFGIYKTIQFSSVHQPDKLHFDILEAVVVCYARQRSTGVSLKEIAREADVSYPTLKKKFKDVAHLKSDVMIHLRTIFIHLVIANFRPTDTNKQKLESYIVACFAWIDYLPSHHAAWYYVLRLGLFEPELRKKNTAMVDTGLDRIKTLIHDGIKANEWQCENVDLVAKKIQLLITGAIFSETTENRIKTEFRPVILELCFSDLKNI